MNLPKEIYLNIFQYLRKTQLMKCSMVCKEWSLSALQIYYDELSFTGRNTNHLIDALDQDQQYFQHCDWVKALKLCQKESENNFYQSIGSSSSKEEAEEKNLTKEQLLKFLTYLPNLKKLILDCSNGKDYLEYLLDLDTDKYLTQLEEISLKDSPFNYDSHYDLKSDIYFKFRNSLKELIVIQEPDSVIVARYGGILYYLNQFKRLTHLKYYNHTDQAITVHQLQVACPNLTTLKLGTSEHILNYQEGSNAFLNTSNLQSLELSFPRMSSSYADMLIHHLPTKLNKLFVQLEDIDLYDWIHMIGLERVLKLAGRMSKLSSAEIRCEPYKDYETESEHEESQMTLFFQVLNAFKGDKKVFCTVDFSDFRSIYKTMRYSNGVLNAIYGLNYQDVYGHNQDDTDSLDFELVVPDKTISNIGPEIFNRLKFYLCTTNDQLPYKILKYSLTNCPQLQYVEFVGMNSPRYEFHLSNSIRRNNYYSRERLDPSTKTEDNLKIIKLQNFVPSDDFLHLLITYLPNVYYFKCGAKYLYHDDEITPPALIDLSGFRKLETFNLNMKFYLTDESDKSCKLKINYIDGQEELIYEFKKVGRDFKISSVSPESSVAPTLTINCKKVMKLIQLNMQRGKLIEIEDGVLQEARSPDFDNERDMIAYFD